MANAYKRTKTAISARKQAERFSTPKGGAVGIRKSNVAKATSSGATKAVRTVQRPLAERDRARDNVSNTVSKGATHTGRPAWRYTAERDRMRDYVQAQKRKRNGK